MFEINYFRGARSPTRTRVACRRQASLQREASRTEVQGKRDRREVGSGKEAFSRCDVNEKLHATCRIEFLSIGKIVLPLCPMPQATGRTTSSTQLLGIEFPVAFNKIALLGSDF